MVLIACGGAARGHHALATRYFIPIVICVAGLLLIIQYPFRTIAVRGKGTDSLDQQAALRRLDAVEQKCQRYRIGADDARRALAPMPVPVSDGWNGFEWLRGSPEPEPRPLDEVRRLLTE